MAARLEVLPLTKYYLLYIHVTLMVPIIQAWFIISMYPEEQQTEGENRATLAGNQ
jgi:hypothetical protein